MIAWISWYSFDKKIIGKQSKYSALSSWEYCPLSIIVVYRQNAGARQSITPLLAVYSVYFITFTLTTNIIMHLWQTWHLELTPLFLVYLAFLYSFLGFSGSQIFLKHEHWILSGSGLSVACFNTEVFGSGPLIALDFRVTRQTITFFICQLKPRTAYFFSLLVWNCYLEYL